MRVIGTAGHVDHGKSTLVRALTGINPDRLKEEQRREMTIELGFAWLTLPGGEEVGVVDVPGHRDFIENMLAGVGGIDAVMFVVAADEGVMPQTREHLAILDLLQVPGGVVALTKCDMVDDPDWLELVEMDLMQVLAGTVLEGAPILRVSARMGSGLDELRQALAVCLAGRPPRADLGRPRLPVDRVFTMPGFGTVVTGTLLDGALQVGDEVEVLPAGLRGRVRGLQSHKRKVERAAPGSRAAVNVNGVELDQVRRGDVLAAPGRYRPTVRLDASFRLLPDASGPLKHSSQVKFFLGAAEVQARVRLLGVEELLPGQEGWLQLELNAPVVAVRGDRYILRRPSPGETLGGGAVVDAHPKGRSKRFVPQVLARLESLRQGAPVDLLLESLLALGAVTLPEAANRARLEMDTAQEALAELVDGGQVVKLEADADGLLASVGWWNGQTQRAREEVGQFHKISPLRRGMPREALKSRLKLAPRVFNSAVRRWTADGSLVEVNETLLALPGFAVRLSAQQQAQVEGLLRQFAEAPFSPPSVKECQAAVGEDVFTALLEEGRLVSVSPEVVFRPEDAARMEAWVYAHFEQQAQLTAAEFRDAFSTSRKYALAFLEYLDGLGITARAGDYRTLRRRQG